MRYIGLDIHKDFCIATEMDKKGNILRGNQKIDTTPTALHAFFSTIKKGKVAIESTSIWEYIYEIITNLGLQVTLVNPVKARAIAEAKIKTDNVDSQILAHLLRSNLIPTVYVGNQDMRDLKRLITERLFLTKQQTQLKNRIHADLLRRGIKPDIHIFTQAGHTYLQALRIPSINRMLTILSQVQKELASIDTDLQAYHNEYPQAQLLTTIPGIGCYTALALIATIGDITRFPSPEKLSAYFGLVPSTHQSATTDYHGHITKQGPSTIRYLLVQCTWVHVTCCTDSFLTHFYHRIAKKKGKSKDIVATARKLTRVIYWMLTKNIPFHSDGYEIRRAHADKTAGI